MKENNIVLDNIKLLKSNLYIYQKEIKSLEVLNDAQINICSSPINNLKITVKKNAHLEINYFNIIEKAETNINIELEENAKFTLNHSFITKDEYKLNIISNFLNENSKLTINLFGINKENTVINIDGYINKNKVNNELLENARIINIDNGKTVVIPNMLIQTGKVSANHNVTISSVPSRELKYLMSKGIDKESAKELILTGHLIKTISDLKLQTKIKELIKTEVI